ncbi:hypothetical protein V8C86DRAFT_575005 [Haematococcus lacustris]
MRSSAQLLCVIVGLLGVAGHLVPSGTSATHQPSVALGGVAIPVSDWYFVIRLSLGWLTRKSPYCGIDPDPSSSELLLTCNRKSVPYASLFTFVTAPEAVGPVVTGQPLMLLSRTSGLCDDGALSRSVGTAGSPPPGTLLQGGPAAAGQRGRSSHRQQASQAVGLRLGAASGEGGAGAGGGWVPMREPGALTGITCKQSHSQLPSSFSLWNSLLLPGLPLNLTAGGDSLYMMQGERYCGVRTVGPHDVVVCDLPSSSGAARFNFQPTGFPFAGLDAFATQQPCGARSLLAPPPHDVQCANTPGFVTYSEGLVGFPLQQCCPLPDSPHVIDCGVAQSDPMPAECWFNLMKVDAKSGTPLEDGDLIMLQSKAFGRYCSISVDGTLLCVSASPSNASRNLFTLRLSRGRLQFTL